MLICRRQNRGASDSRRYVLGRHMRENHLLHYRQVFLIDRGPTFRDVPSHFDDFSATHEQYPFAVETRFALLRALGGDAMKVADIDVFSMSMAIPAHGL